VVGGAGQLGRELVRAFQTAGDDVRSLARPEVDLESPATLEAIAQWGAEIVVNSAAWTDVDGCALDPERAMRINGEGAGHVAAAAERAGAVIVQVSTNEVFDGSSERPYREDDRPSPMNPYGASKLAGERVVAAANPRHLIVRTAWLFSDGPRTFPSRIRGAAERARATGEPLRIVSNEFGNPTWAPDLATAIVQLSGRAIRGAAPDVVHVAGWPPASRLEWARAAIGDVLTAVQVEPIDLSEYSRPSRVPPRAVLDVQLARRLGVQPSDWRAATASLAQTASRT
jgi:dTDP-4-dehydrorhamnose reductase